MKHNLLVLFLLAVAITAEGVPAKPGKTQVKQPDGTTVTLMLHGDEFTHFTTTADNYTVVKTAAGYQYAVKENGQLVTSGITAHDAAYRTTAEKAFLASNTKMLYADKTETEEQDIKRARSLWKAPVGSNEPQKSARYDYNNFRGLVILVEWNDLSFTRTDTKDFFSDMMNTENYNGYYTQNTPQQWVNCTGSVRDYFRDNSMGLFKPEFDVVGPVKINRSCTYPQGAAYGAQCAYEALLATDNIVDFSKYDGDGDGMVDMFYIIYAGYGSNVSGNNDAYIWPHASSLEYSYIKLDGVRMGRYACSTEICSSEIYGDKTLDGIGTICHEFSHVLGLPDLYDTDYESNGQSNDPGVWSVMAGGSYNNNSRTPTGYGAYERYAIGFMQPEIISGSGASYTLEPMNTSNTAYRIDSSVDKEYFLLENRQKTGWDTYLPGSGMLIFRVDSTNTNMWTSNKVNCYSNHNYYEMVRANPHMSNGMILASASDPFPGTAGVMAINNETSPSLKSWTGASTQLSINSIIESGGVISFNVGDADVDSDIEDFETMELTDDDVQGVQGVFCKWNLDKTRVIATTENYGTGNRAIGIARGGILTTSVIEKGVNTIEYDFWNVSKTSVMIRMEYSTDGGSTWTMLTNNEGKTQIQVQANKNVHIKYLVNLPAGTMYRISQTSGLPTTYNCIDNIAVMFSNQDATGIKTPTVGIATDIISEEFFNMAGQRVVADTKGIVIIKSCTADGKCMTRKVIRR